MARVDLLTMGTIFFQNSGIGIIFVFLPVLGKSFTNSLLDVGAMVAMFYLAQFLSSWYFGRISDKMKKRVLFIRLGFAVCAMSFGLSYFIGESSHLFIAMIGTGIAAGIMNPAILAYAYEIQKEKKKTAVIVSFHTLGWLAGIIVTGIINSESIIFLAISVMFIAGFIVSMMLPNKTVKLQENVSTMHIFSRNKIIYSTLLLRHIGASAVFTVLPLMLIENLGAKIYEVSIVYTVNMVSSTILMMIMSRIKISYAISFKIGICISIAAFAGMLFATEWWEMMPFMLLVGISWAFMYIGGMFHLLHNNPKSTSMGIFDSILALGQVIGPVIAGIIAFTYDYISVTWFMFAITILAFGLSLKLKNKRSMKTNT